jgi:hypothetical protein
MDGFDTNTMSWNAAMPSIYRDSSGVEVGVQRPEGIMPMPIMPTGMDQFDQRSTFDAETFAG